MKKNMNNSKLVPIIAMCVLAVGNIALAQSGILNFSAAAPMNLDGLDHASYGVDAVGRTPDGSYLVESAAAGFQSDIAVRVRFHADKKTIQSVEVLYQNETSGIGTKVEDEAFLSQFTDAVAPVSLAGKDIIVASPKAGAGLSVSSEESSAQAAAAAAMTGVWNASDGSPESNAVRALHDAGLLAGSAQGRPLTTAPADYLPEDKAIYQMASAGLTVSSEFIPVEYLEQSSEGDAMRALYAAGLLHSSYEGAALTAPAADYPPEEKAVMKMAQAGLLTAAAAEVQAPPAALPETGTPATEIDAVSGATISSAAVAAAVDNAYFFLLESSIE